MIDAQQTELVRISAAGTEPLLLPEAKLFLRVEALMTDDDSLISGLITAARQYAERFCRRSFLAGEQWKLSLDRFPLALVRDSIYASQSISELYDSAEIYYLQRPGALAIEIPMGPVSAINALTYVDGTGTTQTVDPSEYTLVGGDDDNPKIYAAYGSGWPSTRIYPQAVQVLFTAGAPPEELLVLAMKQMINHWYANREAYVMVSGVVPQQVPLAAERLLWPLRLLEF